MPGSSEAAQAPLGSCICNGGCCAGGRPLAAAIVTLATGVLCLFCLRVPRE